MNRILFFYLSVAGLLISFSASSFADDLPDPQQFKQAAKENLDLSKIQPYILTANIVLSLDANNQERGHITIYRDKDFFRSELEIGTYRELKWILIAGGNGCGEAMALFTSHVRVSTGFCRKRNRRSFPYVLNAGG